MAEQVACGSEESIEQANVGQFGEYVPHPNPHPLFKQTKRSSYSETSEAETYRNSREKCCHGILCDLFIGFSWNHILHPIVLPGRMKYTKGCQGLKRTHPTLLYHCFSRLGDILHVHPSPCFSPEDVKRLTLHGGELLSFITLCPSLGKQTDQMQPLSNPCQTILSHRRF